MPAPSTPQTIPDVTEHIQPGSSSGVGEAGICELRQVPIGGDDGGPDLPAFENFGMDFADDADRAPGDEDAAD